MHIYKYKDTIILTKHQSIIIHCSKFIAQREPAVWVPGNLRNKSDRYWHGKYRERGGGGEGEGLVPNFLHRDPA